MDKNENKIEEFLETEKGKEYLLYILKYPAVRTEIARVLSENKNYCIIETVDFLEFIISMVLKNERIVPAIIEDKCNSMRKYDAADFKFYKNEIFDILIMLQTEKQQESIVPAFALLDFEKLKDPEAVFEIIDSISDILIKYKQYSDIESVPNKHNGSTISKEIFDKVVYHGKDMSYIRERAHELGLSRNNQSDIDEEVFDEDAANSEDALCEYLRANNFNI